MCLPQTGSTASDMANQYGREDIVALLAQAAVRTSAPQSHSQAWALAFLLVFCAQAQRSAAVVAAAAVRLNPRAAT